MSRRVEDLYSVLSVKAVELQRQAKSVGLDIIFTYTWRSFKEQDILWNKGRTTPGVGCKHKGDQVSRKIGSCLDHPLGVPVTWAKSGESFHNFALAFDFLVLKNGKEDWENTKAFITVGELGEDLGLQWGGRYLDKKKDMPHFQMSFGFSLHELNVFYQLGGLRRVFDECTKKLEKGLWL